MLNNIYHPWGLGNFKEYSHSYCKIEQDDTVVFDTGAYVGDSMLYFYHEIKVKNSNIPQIHCFELADQSIEILKENIKINNINPEYVKINKNALMNTDDKILTFNSGGAGTRVNTNNDGTNKVTSITIDSYVKKNKLTKVDFIKMDIEGAERLALAGAQETIKELKPKLAICIYHIWDDPFVIPELIHGINKNYNFYFDWSKASINFDGGILFAVPVEEISKLNPLNISAKATQEEIMNAFIAMLNSSSKGFNKFAETKINLVKAKQQNTIYKERSNLAEIYNKNYEQQISVLNNQINRLKNKWHKKLVRSFKKRIGKLKPK